MATKIITEETMIEIMVIEGEMIEEEAEEEAAEVEEPEVEEAAREGSANLKTEEVPREITRDSTRRISTSFFTLS